HRAIFAHVLFLQGRYDEALGELEAAMVGEPGGNLIAYLFALSGKSPALLLSGRLSELLGLLREGRAQAAKNGNDPWLFTFREAWLRTVVLDFAGAQSLCETMIREGTDLLRAQPRTIARLAEGYAALDQDRPDDALRSFAAILDADETPKFFLHWYWRIQAL